MYRILSVEDSPEEEAVLRAHIDRYAAENKLDRLELPFHKSLVNDELPLTIGGGIGQSRLCMQILQKAQKLGRHFRS